MSESTATIINPEKLTPEPVPGGLTVGPESFVPRTDINGTRPKIGESYVDYLERAQASGGTGDPESSNVPNGTTSGLISDVKESGATSPHSEVVAEASNRLRAGISTPRGQKTSPETQPIDDGPAGTFREISQNQVDKLYELLDKVPNDQREEAEVLQEEILSSLNSEQLPDYNDFFGQLAAFEKVAVKTINNLVSWSNEEKAECLNNLSAWIESSELAYTRRSFRNLATNSVSPGSVNKDKLSLQQELDAAISQANSIESSENIDEYDQAVKRARSALRKLADSESWSQEHRAKMEQELKNRLSWGDTRQDDEEGLTEEERQRKASTELLELLTPSEGLAPDKRDEILRKNARLGAAIVNLDEVRQGGDRKLIDQALQEIDDAYDARVQNDDALSQAMADRVSHLLNTLTSSEEYNRPEAGEPALIGSELKQLADEFIRKHQSLIYKADKSTPGSRRAGRKQAKLKAVYANWFHDLGISNKPEEVRTSLNKYMNLRREEIYQLESDPGKRKKLKVLIGVGLLATAGALIANGIISSDDSDAPDRPESSGQEVPGSQPGEDGDSQKSISELLEPFNIEPTNGYTQELQDSFPGHKKADYYDLHNHLLSLYGQDYIQGVDKYLMPNGDLGLAQTGEARFANGDVIKSIQEFFANR